MVSRFIEGNNFFYLEMGFKQKKIATILVESQYLMILWIGCSDLLSALTHTHDPQL
jgi:hypothetical protein